MIPTAVIIGERIALNRGRVSFTSCRLKRFIITVVPLAIPEFEPICSLTIGNITAKFITPYIVVIFYECGMFHFVASSSPGDDVRFSSSVNLALTLIQIVKWRRIIPENVRAPIIDTLWRDGKIVFRRFIRVEYLLSSYQVSCTFYSCWVRIFTVTSSL